MRRSGSPALGATVVFAIGTVIVATHADSSPPFGFGGRFETIQSTAGGVVPDPIVESVPKARTMEHRKWVHTFAFSPDSRLLAVSTADGAIFFWDVATGVPTGPEFKKAAFGPSCALRFTADGKHLIRIWAGGVTVWDALTGEVLLSRDLLEAVRASPDGMTLALGPRPEWGRPKKVGPVVLWDVRTRQARDVPVAGKLGEFSPAGDRLAIVAADRVVLVPLSDGPSSTIPFGEEKDKKARPELLFAADGRLLATAMKGRIAIWDARVGTQIGPMLDSGGPRWCPTCLEATFTAGNEVLAARGEKVVKFWEVTSGRLLAETAELAFGRNTGGVWLLPGPKAQLLAISPSEFDPGHFPARRETGPLALWDLGARPPRVLDSLAGAIPVAFSPDGETLVYKVTGGFSLGAVGGPLGLWSVKRGTTVAMLDGKCRVGDSPRDSYLANPAFSPDGMWIACAGWPKWQDISLWDVSHYR